MEFYYQCNFSGYVLDIGIFKELLNLVLILWEFGEISTLKDAADSSMSNPLAHIAAK